MCRSLNRAAPDKPAQAARRECRKVGNNRPNSRGRDRRPQGECGGLAAALRRARQHSARWIAGPSERTTENRGISAAACRHHELPEAAIQAPVGADVLLAMAGMAARAGNRAATSRWVPAPILGPYYHL